MKRARTARAAAAARTAAAAATAAGAAPPVTATVSVSMAPPAAAAAADPTALLVAAAAAAQAQAQPAEAQPVEVAEVAPRTAHLAQPMSMPFMPGMQWPGQFMPFMQGSAGGAAQAGTGPGTQLNPSTRVAGVRYGVSAPQRRRRAPPPRRAWSSRAPSSLGGRSTACGSSCTPQHARHGARTEEEQYNITVLQHIFDLRGPLDTPAATGGRPIGASSCFLHVPGVFSSCLSYCR